MAGLLGTGWEDPQSQGIMALAGGLLQGNFGAGVQNMGTVMAGAQDAAMKRKLMQSQLDNYASEIEARKLATVKDARQQGLIESMFGGQPGAATPPDAGSTTGGAPASSGSVGAPRVGLIDLARQYGIPEQAIQADMVFNGGKKISEMLEKHGTRDMQVTNGYAYDKNKLGAGYLPSLSTSQDGKTSMVQIGPDGMPVVSAPRGAMETFGGYQGAQAGYAAAGRVNLRENPDGTKSPVSELTENPTLQGMIGMRPAPAAAQPGYGNESQMKTTVGGGMGADPAALQREIKATQNSLFQKNLDEPSRAMLRDHLAGLQRQAADPRIAAASGPAPTPPPASPTTAPAYGMTNAQSAQADANKTRMVDSSKAGTERVMKGYDGAQAAVDTITSNIEARKSLAGGAFLGFGADAKLSISKAAQAMGIEVSPEKVTNTDYLQSTLGQGILNKAKTLGANPTDNDARIIRSIVGSIGTDPQALNKLLDHQDVMANRAIEQHNKNYADAKGRGFDAGFDLTVKPPVSAAPPKPAAAPKLIDALPTPNASNKGQRIRDTTTGKILTSNGLQWKAE